MTITSTSQLSYRKATFTYYEHASIWPGCLFYRARSGGTASTSYESCSKTKDSVNGSGYYIKKKVYVSFVPQRPLKKPIEPKLRLSRLPIKPTKRPSQSQRSFNRVLNAYNQLFNKVVVKRARQLEGYNVALQRYKVRLESWIKYTSWASAGRPVMKRVRSKLALSNHPYTLTQVNTTPLSGNVKTSMRNRTITGCYTDVWSLPDARGSNLLMTTVDGDCEFVMGTPVYPGAPADYSACLGSSDSHARAKLRQNMNEQHAHVGNIIAERHQTIKMLGDIAKLILKATPRQLLKSALSREGASNAVLAYNFGIKPLIEDAYGIAQSLAKLTSLPDKITVHGKSTKRFSSLVKTETLVSSGIPYLVKQFFEETTITTHYACDYSIDNGTLSYLNGIGLVNPAEIAWEVMPWSFVIDWFWPIGNFISAISSEAGLSFMGGTKTVTTHRVMTAKYAYTGIPRAAEQYTREYGTAIGSKIIKSKVRTVLSSTPQLQLPDFKSPFSFTHIAETLALISQRIR